MEANALAYKSVINSTAPLITAVETSLVSEGKKNQEIRRINQRRSEAWTAFANFLGVEPKYVFEKFIKYNVKKCLQKNQIVSKAVTKYIYPIDIYL